jgi:hypothetical protein
MKTLNFENLCDIVLSNEEMINVRGGIGGYGITDGPTKPPVIVEL